ncbi:zinc-dependent alcohol dehydrogenase [Nitrospira sp. Nam74]
MKAVMFYGAGDIRVSEAPEPRIQQRRDAIVRLTASAICGTDLHMVRGTMPAMEPGTILGHEGVGIVEDVGPDVRNLRAGDRVVIASTIACGTCSYCRAGYFAQCDRANPNGPRAGTAFFGGPKTTGSFPGLQAERARIPYANVGLIRLPDEVSDEQAIMLSDIFPTGYFGADLAEIRTGDTVAVFGCGPVGQFAIASAWLHGATRVLAVDTIPSRLQMAQAQGAEVIDFQVEDPIQAMLRLTEGIGVDRVIDAVGVDATRPHEGPASQQIKGEAERFQREVEEVAERVKPTGENWHPGDAPSLVFSWAAEALAKAGTLAIIGVYPETARTFPIGKAMNMNLTVKMGNCHHRRYIPMLIDLVKRGTVDPSKILTQAEPLASAIDAYKAFDAHSPGWMKVKLEPQVAQAKAS